MRHGCGCDLPPGIGSQHRDFLVGLTASNIVVHAVSPAGPGELYVRKNPSTRAVTPEHRQGLRCHAESLPIGTAIPITREHLLALLDREASLHTDALSPPDRLLTAEEVAGRLAVDVQTVRRRQKQLGAVKIGRSVRFPERGVERFLGRRALNRQAPA
jgi:excisionase family DNA binding protein